MTWTLFLALTGCKNGLGSGAHEQEPGDGSAQNTSASGAHDPGRVVLHRLNRTEYDNTVRDLLGTSLTPARDFPTDDMVAGFDNIAANLTVSPLHIELYELAAEALADEVLATPAGEAGEALAFRAEGEGAITATAGAPATNAWNLHSNGTLSAQFTAPSDGTYELSARVWASQTGTELAAMALGHDGVEALLVDVAAEDEAAAEEHVVEVELTAGVHTIEVSFLNDSYDAATGADRNLFVDWVDVYGPTEVPASGDLRDRLIGCDPEVVGDEACAREVLSQLADRAWRRPHTAEELDRLMGIVSTVLDDGGTFDEAVKYGMISILVSPHFVYRVEVLPDPTSTEPHELSDYEIASRLSYFLWSTMPDDELFAAAAAGELSTPEQLEAQVLRMLADDKARALVDNFGGQWLFMRGVDTVEKDPLAYPGFDEDLRASMKEEMRRFFDGFVFGGRDMRELLTATEGEIDAVLAAHYGATDYTGPGWQTVDLGALDRGGVLGQAGLLTVESYPTRTSPVIRGKFVLSQLLCDEPPPPPAGVEGLDENVTAQTLREQLEQHRADPTCASCHVVMDELGFGLEHFDALGAWRDEDRGFPVDAFGSLPDGTSFYGAREMSDVLAGDPRFPLCMTEKLYTYALGRVPSGADDNAYIDEIEAAFAADGYAFEALAVAIARSDAFRKQRGEQ